MTQCIFEINNELASNLGRTPNKKGCKGVVKKIVISAPILFLCRVFEKRINTERLSKHSTCFGVLKDVHGRRLRREENRRFVVLGVQEYKSRPSTWKQIESENFGPVVFENLPCIL